MAIPKETVLEMYWRMLLSRRLDERAWELHRGREIAFHHSSIGHEAAQVGAAFAVQRQRDWVAPYYRDLALLLTLGLTPREFMLNLMGKADDPVSGGRQLPSLWSLRRINVLSNSPTNAAQISHAVGVALAMRLGGADGVVLAVSGEGATSAGEWYESVNWAAVERLPVVFFVENNRYAISTPVERQMAVASVSDKARGLGLPGVAIDGQDVLAVYGAVKAAIDRAREGGGPALVEARTFRVPPHSSDDDDRLYRSRQEVQKGRTRDPLLILRAVLEKAEALSPQTSTHMESRALEIVEDAVAFARQAPYPTPASASGPVYFEEI
jgi:2-oxoisovalerate dehydrogenase E1 component subunit alpha